ncbi:tetratricopeptide repeat protein, partial [Treponema endosymbiont of Eucomonympha sp.]|uniref:tetratricopeptide repeat protein n=1 Tax=Treponema endosymbiont of Eucomonympha sp. TaxID=1580831 RepID=UPI000AAC1067
LNAEAAAFGAQGNERYAKKEYDAAIEAYTKATELQPDFAEAFHNRGFVYEQKGDYGKAIADYDAAIRLKPDLAARASYQDIVWKIAPDDLWNYETETLVKFRHFFARFIVVYKKKGTDSEAHKELVRALHSLWKDCLVDESNASSGKYLYQYASMSAFEKMFESRALRLAPTAYQNDSEEGKVFFAEIEGILTARQCGLDRGKEVK